MKTPAKKSAAPVASAAPATVERRSGKDRRVVDIPPPKGRERRRTAEPRKPEVTEIDMTQSQWGRLNSTKP
jgi:hypothetical protein